MGRELQILQRTVSPPDHCQGIFFAFSTSLWMCPHQVLCVPMCPVSGSGVAQGAVMGLSPPGGEFSEVQHLARRRRHRPRRNPRPAPLLMAHFRPSLVITQYLHCAVTSHKSRVSPCIYCILGHFSLVKPVDLKFFQVWSKESSDLNSVMQVWFGKIKVFL